MTRLMTRCSFVFLAASVAILWAAPGPASARTVDAEDLIVDLDDFAAGYDVDFSDVDAVRLDDGTTVPFDPGVLEGSTSAEDAAIQAAMALAALNDASDGVDTERARSTARQVVDELDLDPEEQPPPDPPELSNASPFAAFGQILGYAAMAAALVGIGFAIYALVRSMTGRTKDDDDETSGVETSTGALEDETPIDAFSADEWTARAAAAEAEGRYADAVRFLHYAGLLRLDEDGTVPFDSSRTNGGYVDEAVALSTDAAQDLLGLNRLMEDATYGHLPADPEDVGRTRSGWQQVRTALATAPRHTEEGT